MTTLIEISENDQKLERQFDELVSESFGVSEGTAPKFLENFPVWRNQSGAQIKRWGAVENQSILSSVALRLAQLKLDGDKIKIGVIGGVATQKAARGQGLATRLLDQAIDFCDSEGVEIALLFGSEFEFYAKLGFLPAGKQFRIPLSDFVEPRPITATKISEGYDEQVIELMKIRAQGLVIENSGSKWIPLHKNTRWICAQSVEGKVSAYVALGRGIDLLGFIHDFGGDADALHSIFSKLQREQPGELQLLGPSSEFLRLKIPLGKAHCDPLCLAKPLTPRAPELLGKENFWLWGLDGA